jgi:hypothetical protein
MTLIKTLKYIAILEGLFLKAYGSDYGDVVCETEIQRLEKEAETKIYADPNYDKIKEFLRYNKQLVLCGSFINCVLCHRLFNEGYNKQLVLYGSFINCVACHRLFNENDDVSGRYFITVFMYPKDAKLIRYLSENSRDDMQRDLKRELELAIDDITAQALFGFYGISSEMVTEKIQWLVKDMLDYKPVAKRGPKCRELVCFTN